ncbi:neuropeptide-like 4 [Drosophila gunungcola]|uniref:neuropeptide-like 4 n=1 Tax=Drosophila gunungcola TaxID=103775 RepID=UPI0022E35BE5|nr:neuropeptide-like 4 [Drosophila gunungcola]
MSAIFGRLTEDYIRPLRSGEQYQITNCNRNTNISSPQGEIKTNKMFKLLVVVFAALLAVALAVPAPVARANPAPVPIASPEPAPQFYYGASPYAYSGGYYASPYSYYG